MSVESENATPDQKAQSAYNQTVGLLRGLHGKDKLAFEIAAHEELGKNSLKLLLNGYGVYDAGWIDDIELDDSVRDRLFAFTWQELVATNAIAKAALRAAHESNRRLRIMQWIMGVFLLVTLVGSFS